MSRPVSRGISTIALGLGHILENRCLGHRLGSAYASGLPIAILGPASLEESDHDHANDDYGDDHSRGGPAVAISGEIDATMYIVVARS